MAYLVEAVQCWKLRLRLRLSMSRDIIGKLSSPTYKGATSVRGDKVVQAAEARYYVARTSCCISRKLCTL